MESRSGAVQAAHSGSNRRYWRGDGAPAREGTLRRRSTYT